MPPKATGRSARHPGAVAVDLDAAVFLDHGHRVLDDREGAQAEEIHFQEAHALHVVHRVLGDHLVLGAFGQRHDVVQGLRRDHDAGSVHRSVPRQALQAARRLDQLGDLRVAFLHFLQPRLLFHGVIERHVEPVGYELGDAVHIAVGHVHGASHVANHPFGQHGAEGDDLGHVVGPVFFGDVADDLVAPLHAEIDVDVGHGDTFGVQEALEHQVIGERIDVGNAQDVRHKAAGYRAAARAHGDAVLAGVANEIPDDQKVPRIPGVPDNDEFLIEALLVGLVSVLASVAAAAVRQSLFKSLAGDPFQVGVKVYPVGRVVTRQKGLVKRQTQVATFGDQQGVGARLRHLSEDTVHFLRGLDVEFFLLVPHAMGIVHALAGADAHENVMRRGVLLAQVVAVIGGNDRQPEVLAELQEFGVGPALSVHPVIHELQVHVVGPQDLAVAVDGVARLFQVAVQDVSVHLSLETARKADQPLRVFRQEFLVDARPVVEAFQERLAQQPREILVAGEVSGQQGQVVRRRANALAAAVEACRRRHVGLATQDRLDAARLRRLVELHGAEHVAVVGDGHRGHAEFRGAVQEFVDPVRSIQQAELGVQVKMNEALLAHEIRFLPECARYSAW